ncbi:metallophosphoesterase [Mycoplasmatota bacterium WC30]
MKKYFILSDIHSQYDLLIDAINRIGFDESDQDHILIIAGDVLDRGKQGDAVIRYLENLIILNRVLGVVGNHDAFLIDILNHNYKLDRVKFNIEMNGFKETLKLGITEADFEITEATLDIIRETFESKYAIFTKWLRELPLFLEYANHVIVHGFLDFSLSDWRDTTSHYAVWERGYNNVIPDTFKKKIIFGHTPNSHINNQNDIIYDGKKIMIDGGAASGVQINVLVLTDIEI